MSEFSAVCPPVDSVEEETLRVVQDFEVPSNLKLTEKQTQRLDAVKASLEQTLQEFRTNPDPQKCREFYASLYSVAGDYRTFLEQRTASALKKHVKTLVQLGLLPESAANTPASLKSLCRNYDPQTQSVFDIISFGAIEDTADIVRLSDQNCYSKRTLRGYHRTAAAGLDRLPISRKPLVATDYHILGIQALTQREISARTARASREAVESDAERQQLDRLERWRNGQAEPEVEFAPLLQDQEDADGLVELAKQFADIFMQSRDHDDLLNLFAVERYFSDESIKEVNDILEHHAPGLYAATLWDYFANFPSHVQRQVDRYVPTVL